MERKHTINTGLYSDYAMNLLNDLRQATMMVGSSGSVNREIYTILKDPPDYLELYKPQKYGFRHAANGEVCLIDVEIRPGRYYHYGFRHDNKKYLELIALQIKEIAKFELDVEADWRRYNFDCKIRIGNSEYPIAELYFIFDFFWNHMKSVNAFKQEHIDVVNKIVGSPRDPILSEFIETSDKKTKELWREYLKNIDELVVSEVKGYSTTEADKELSRRIENLYKSFKEECEQKKVELGKKLQEDLAKCEIPKALLVSNNITL